MSRNMSRLTFNLVSPSDERQLAALDEFVALSPYGHLLQTTPWARVQEISEKQTIRVCVIDEESGRIILSALVLVHQLPFGQTYLYCPCGPIFEEERGREAVELFLQKLPKLEQLRQRSPLFLRIDPRIPQSPSSDFFFNQFHFRESVSHIQPVNTRVLDLQTSEEKLLSQMKPKTRYNIRLAQKKDIRVEKTSHADAVETFYHLMQQTAERDKFKAHAKTYYRHLIDVLGKKSLACFFIVRYQGQPVAAIMVTFFGNTATYLHGASDYAHRNLMAPYLLQWRAIQDAKERGCTQYDFWGIAPQGTPNHPWQGVTTFKEGFGGSRVDYIGTLDLVYRKVPYALYCIIKKFT